MILFRNLFFCLFFFCTHYTDGWAQTTPKRDFDCEQMSDFTRLSTVFIMDKTTNLSDVDIKAWRDAVTEVFADPSISGRVSSAEIEDTNVSFRLSSPQCVRALSAPPKPALGGLESQINSHVPTTIATNVHEIFTKLSDWVMSFLESSPSQEQQDQTLADSRLRMLYRDYVVTHILSLADERDETDTSAIVGPIFQIIQAECSGREHCRIFIFSDFIDTEIRRELIRSPKTANELSNMVYNNFSKEYNFKLSNTILDIVAWGIGRDESGAPKPLRPELRRPLRIFWENLFGKLCESAAQGSGISLTDKFSGIDSRSCR